MRPVYTFQGEKAFNELPDNARQLQHLRALKSLSRFCKTR